MSTSSRPDAVVITQTVNALLLRTFALLQTPLSVLTLHQALNFADKALATASHFHRFDLEPRAHLYRGHVLRAWGRWRAAHAAYVRAASVRGQGFSGTDIRGLTKYCLEMIRFENEREERLRQAYFNSVREARKDKEGKEGSKAVRFSDQRRVPRIFHRHDDDEGAQSDESSGEMYLILNGNGEVIGSRESLPDLRTVRGKFICRSPTA
ncbi:uncharacterized protein ColSpa_11128 [Colletotrichum spaethianum]|uniref:Uncharacterized protein n=1 Tax=Colletotrichum spaethianum TaxID=700344 RepID=A0AA37PEW8_9PEZI|nr:uncharacterized protein ColSpa_11128 [Colletotrichum spaethianum]GKT50947.1 hypothetical protein ColSpa_11128 [Colletotrichum spaethianum]